jgi:hypothetical protein
MLSTRPIHRWRHFRRLIPAISVATPNPPPPVLNSPPPATARRPRGGHSCQCLCPTCEASGTGYFAQLALLGGDHTAAQKLSPAVGGFLQMETKDSALPPLSDGVEVAWR